MVMIRDVKKHTDGIDWYSGMDGLFGEVFAVSETQVSVAFCMPPFLVVREEVMGIFGMLLLSVDMQTTPKDHSGSNMDAYKAEI